GVVLSTATIQVTVCERPEPGPNPEPDPNPDPNPNPGPAPVAASPSYSFENYSKPGISLALCQYMFGDNQMARTVYYYDVGNGGVCFGLAATAGLLSGTNAPDPDAFGKTSMSALRKSDYSTTLDPDMGLSLTDFIEAMHISQVAYYHMRELSGVQNLVDEVRRGGNSQPAIVCLRGAEGGHALLAYGLTESGALRVYDSNYPEQERTLNISGENWSYDIAPRIRWNQSNGQISYIPYDTYYSAWHIHRGSLNTAFSSRYLLATTADNFALTVFDANYDAPDGEEPYQRQVAVYADGALQPGHDENIEEVFVSNVPLDDGDTSHLHMLYVPGEELYTVRNDGSQLMNVTLSGDGLSVRVNSEAEKFVLAVSDAERFAAALLNGLQEGEYYSISVGSSLDGDGEDPVDSASIEGYGNGQAICLGIGEGLGALGFDNSEGLCVAGGDRTENADFSALSALSLHAMENDGPRPFAQDFALHSTRTATEYPLTARAGAGGRILPQNAVSVPENGNYTFRVQPDDGYSLKAIYVNGVQAAYGSGSPSYSYYNGAYEYTFRDVTQPGFLYAEFARDMRACQVTGTPGGGVTVTDGDRTLTEGVDYAWSVSGNQLVVRALADSAYSGVSMTLYDVPAPSLVWNSHNANEINLTARDVQNPVILAVAYSLDNLQMLTVLPPAELSDDTGDGIPVRIPLTGAALPRQYLVSVFMLSDTGTMRVLCAPVEVTISGAPATTS
ncbi:MAG: hypothetical protein IJR48_07635, partial [Oscillibacter sp.]|nr:hypothetical protein [Oscillibacter sp.]